MVLDVMLFLAALGLRSYVPTFSSCSEGGLLPGCEAQDPHCRGLSGCGARAVGARALVVAYVGSIAAAPWLQDTDSGVAARRLSCLEHMESSRVGD